MQRNETIADYLRTICHLPPIYSKRIKKKKTRPGDNHWVYASKHKQIWQIFFCSLSPSFGFRPFCVWQHRICFVWMVRGSLDPLPGSVRFNMLQSIYQKPILVCSLWLYSMFNISFGRCRPTKFGQFELVAIYSAFLADFGKCADSTLKLKCASVCGCVCVYVNYSV